MAAKYFQRRPHLFTSSICKALPPFLFSCIAIWFFSFLLNRSRYHSPGPGSNFIPKLDANSDVQVSNETASNGDWLFDHRGAMSNQAKKTQRSDGVSPIVSEEADCDLSSGRWVRDEQRRPVYDETCRDIFKGWNCLRNNKSNSREILVWRWQPWKCDLPQLNPNLFLDYFKHKRIGFIGDSLNRNMYVSLVCSLKQASGQVKKWRPVGADKAVTFLSHNLTLAYHRTNLLARSGRWQAKADGGQLESLGYMEGLRVDVDVPQSTWADASRFHDVLILNTGHWWWAPKKFDPVRYPMLFFDVGAPIVPVKSPEEGLDLVLKNMLNFIEREMPAKGLKFLRTQSPRHFEGGEWDEGGKCDRLKPLTSDEVEAFFAIGSRGPNVEMTLVNQHLKEAVKGTGFQLLNISYMSSLRADAHPSKSAGKLHDDCMHWCLPGVTDFWNDMFAFHLLQYSVKTLQT